MSWSTRITSAPNCAGIRRITDPDVLRLGSSGRPAAGSSRSTTRGSPDDCTRQLDEPPLAGAECADLRLGRHVETDELDRREHVGPPCRSLRRRVLVDHRDVVEDGELLDRLLGLERPAETPPRATEVGHLRAGRRRSRGSLPAAGRTKPLRTLKNVVLPAPFGPINPQVPLGKTTLTSSIGVTPANRTVSPVTSITAPSSLPPPGSRTPRDDEPARASRVLRQLVGEPARCGQQHLEEPHAEEDQDEVRVEPPLRLEEERHALLEDAGDDRTPEAEDPADQRGRGRG